MSKDKNLKQWEKDKVSALTLKMILAATAGTLLATALAYILRQAGLGEIKPELLFAPWGIVLVYGVSIAFHQGVEAERSRAANESVNK